MKFLATANSSQGKVLSFFCSFNFGNNKPSYGQHHRADQELQSIRSADDTGIRHQRELAIVYVCFLRDTVLMCVSALNKLMLIKATTFKQLGSLKQKRDVCT